MYSSKIVILYNNQFCWKVRVPQVPFKFQWLQIILLFSVASGVRLNLQRIRNSEGLNTPPLCIDDETDLTLCPDRSDFEIEMGGQRGCRANSVLTGR